MIEIRYTEPLALDLSGNLIDMRYLYKQIQKFLSSKDNELIFEANCSIDPRPYAKTLNRFILTKGVGPTKVYVYENDLNENGSIDNLKGFLSYFNFSTKSKDGDHYHHEYFEGNIYISFDSVPLVISLKK